LIRILRAENYKYIKFSKSNVGGINNLKRDVLAYAGQKFLTPDEVLVERESEDENIITQHPEQAKEMKNELGSFESDSEFDNISIGERKREELEDLGYL
jgi:hypothetical protein